MKKVMITLSLLMLAGCSIEKEAKVVRVGECTRDCFGCQTSTCSVELSDGTVTELYAPVMIGQKAYKYGAWHKSNN